jgi:hypothetical protein
MSFDISSARPAHVDARLRRASAGAALSSLALLAAACIGENPIDVDARVGVFALLGGLDVGEALTLQGRQAERIALPGGASGADFVIVPFLGSDVDATVTVGIDGAVLLDAVGPPASARVPRDGVGLLGRRAFAAEAATARFHERLRAREIERLEPSLRSTSRRATDMRARGVSEPPAPVPVVGDILSLRVINEASTDLCEAPLEREGRVAAVSNRAIMVSDVDSPAELSNSDLAAVAAEFDALVFPVGVESFGEPTDLDVNDRVIIFFTPVVNESEALGFFFAGDLFTQSSCPASNEAEIVYILSPDPSGVTAVPADAEDVSFLASDIVAHELQHLINASRRVYVNDAMELETVWLNEGLSHIAEELIFYASTPFGPGQNIDLDMLLSAPAVTLAADRFVVGNFLFYASYAADPTETSLTGLDTNATRGASWAFLRYAADHEGRPDSEFFHDLVNTTSSGLANLNAVLETGDALELMQAWTASVFSDDHVVGVPDFLTQPSWDFRSALPALMDDGSFPLDLEVVEADGGQAVVSLNGGASAFFQVRVGAARNGELRLDVSGSSSAALRVSVIRSR